MFTHPETVCSLSAFDYQQRLREAAKERIAASAQAGERSPLTIPMSAHSTAGRLGLLRSLLQSARRVRLSRPLASS